MSRTLATASLLLGALGAGLCLDAGMGLPRSLNERADADPTLRALEAELAHHRGDAAVASRLVDAYLDRGQPGHAAAALEFARPDVTRVSALLDARARTLADLGQPWSALEAERSALAACEREACAPALEARVTRRLTTLRARVLGVDPSGAQALLEPVSVQGGYGR